MQACHPASQRASKQEFHFILVLSACVTDSMSGEVRTRADKSAAVLYAVESPRVTQVAHACRHWYGMLAHKGKAQNSLSDVNN